VHMLAWRHSKRCVSATARTPFGLLSLSQNCFAHAHVIRVLQRLECPLLWAGVMHTQLGRVAVLLQVTPGFNASVCCTTSLTHQMATSSS
jgi:hypothetical protein